MKKTVLACVLAGFAAGALAVPETYDLDPLHTAARFEYSHLDWTTQVHRFDQTSGKVVFDPETKTGSVDVTIDAKTVNTGSAMFNSQIQGERLFDTAKYPTITFKSTGLKFQGDKLVAVDGDLTVKGVTKPVTLTVTSFHYGQHPAQKQRQGLGGNAFTKVKRSEFNMPFNVPLIGDEVTISIAFHAFKAQ